MHPVDDDEETYKCGDVSIGVGWSLSQSHTLDSAKTHKRLLTFKDHALEDDFLRSCEEPNRWVATMLLSVALVLEVFYALTVATFWRTEGFLRVFLLCSTISGITGAGVPLACLRLRCCSCEIAVLSSTMWITVTVFTNNAYFMARLLSLPGDFILEYHDDEPVLIMSLVVLSACVQEAIHLRSCRCWILPAWQVFLLGGVHFGLAPLPYANTLLICVMHFTATYFAWRNRRRDERKERADFLENRELRLVMEREREANKIQRRRLRDIDNTRTAMDALAGRASTSECMVADATEAKTAPVSVLCKEDLTVLRPSRCVDLASRAPEAVSIVPPNAPEATATAAPNKLLRRAMAGQRADSVRIRKMAERIVSSDYSIKEFFEDVVAAFPELELFFALHDGGSQPQLEKGELEYQRTICAFFSVYWLLRLDQDGKHGFCFGVTSDWQARELVLGPMASSCPNMNLSGFSKREQFLEEADWATIQEIVNISMGSADKPVDIERVEAMLCLTAIHDVLKMEWLCPTVAEEHSAYKGYPAGAVIHDHDVAISYVMEHYPELLPSYSILPPQMQELVLFTQSKMQFNHGWFVQAEAPPGLMLSSLKGCLAAARPGDLPFYFFHWLTDLSGAEGTPKGGAEKFVIKFPEKVLAAFLWSIPFLDRLEGRTETQVVEQYLAARWHLSFPNTVLPHHGPSSIALLRLTVMAQNEAEAVADAFHSLPLFARELLSEELARTGCEEQYFNSCPARGGPALLIYYGPALLQRCRGVDEMKMGLQILAAVCSSGRGLWPLSMKSQGRTVIIDAGALRAHEVSAIMGSTTITERNVWVVLPKNDREASLELFPAGELNQFNRRRLQYWILDPQFGGDSDRTVSFL